MLASGNIDLPPVPATNRLRNESHSEGGASSHPSSKKQTFLPRSSAMALATLFRISSLGWGIRSASFVAEWTTGSLKETWISSLIPSKILPAAHSLQAFQDKVVFPDPATPSTKMTFLFALEFPAAKRDFN